MVSAYEKFDVTKERKTRAETPLESHTQMDPAPLESHTQMELQKEEQELLLDQIHMIYEKKLDKVRKYFLKEIQDLKGIIEQQTEVLQEVKKSHEAELSEICLKHSKELQAEKDTCSNLNNKMKLMQKQFQKMKEVMQVQSHEISTLKEEVQGLHDQHKDEEKTKSLEKMQNKTVQEQTEVEEISRSQESIHKLKQKLEVKKIELCTERQILRNTKIVVEKMKSSILQLERSAVSQMKSQTFEPRPPQTPHPKIQKFAMPAVVLSQEMEKNHQDMTQEKWTKFDACVRTVGSKDSQQKSGRFPMILPYMLSTRSQRLKLPVKIVTQGQTQQQSSSGSVIFPPIKTQNTR